MSPAAREYNTLVTTAAILTIGNEVVSGDIPNTNATWLAQRLETLGVHVALSAAVPDDEAPSESTPSSCRGKTQAPTYRSFSSMTMRWP